MGRRLILDTGVLIAFERGKLSPADVLEPDDDVVIAAVTVAELRVGAKLADDTHRPQRDAAIARALTVFSVEDYTSATSEPHAELLVHCRKTGAPRGAIDLIIAATAIATSRTVVSLDQQADFGGLPGVQVITP